MRRIMLPPAGNTEAEDDEIVAERRRRLVMPGDCPVVLLTPKNPEAARFGIHVHQDDSWWISAADGPGTEVRDDMKEDRHLLLERLVRSVIQGHYRHGPCTREVKRLFRPPRLLEGWYELFETERERVSTRHFGLGAPAAQRRFEPY